MINPANQVVLVTVAVLGPLGSAAIAQSAASGAAGIGVDSNNQITEIVVTAQKFEQRLIDVPQSVSVLSSADLEAIHAERFDDFFTRVPSAAVDEVRAGNTRLILRGLNTGGVGSTVATYVDETPVGSVTSNANGAILTPDLDLGDVQRVEVLRGPQGTLYGASSLGGLVKYVTTAPSTDGIHGMAEISGEDVEHGSVGYSGKASVNIPLGPEAAVRASAFYRHDPGYIDDPRWGTDINDGRTYGGRLSALFTPTDAFSIRATATLQNLYSNGTNQVDVDPVTLQPVVGELQQSRAVEQPNNMQYRVYNVALTYDFGPVKLLSSTSFSTLSEREFEDETGALNPLLVGVLGNLGYSQLQHVDTHTATEELRLSSSAWKILDWTVGGFFSHEHSDIDQMINGVDFDTAAAIPAFADLATANLDSRFREFAGFANGTFHLAPKFDLTLGGRYSRNNQIVTQYEEGPLAGGAPSTLASISSDSSFTYSVAPSFKPTQDTTIYGRISKGYRPGGPNTVPPFAPAVVPLVFHSDTTTNYEVGIKSEFAQHTVELEFTGFIIDWHDIQLFTVIDNFGVDVNGSGARSDGVEFSATYRPVKGLELTANGAYVNARLTSDAPAVVGGVKGDHLPYTARFASTVAAEYRQPLTAAVEAIGGLSWRFTGNRESGFDTTFGQHELPSYSSIDATWG